MTPDHLQALAGALICLGLLTCLGYYVSMLISLRTRVDEIEATMWRQIGLLVKQREEDVMLWTRPANPDASDRKTCLAASQANCQPHVEGETMKLRPIQDNVLIRRLPQETVTPGGIIIPDKAQAKATQAEVVAAGPGKHNKEGVLIPMTVKPGDKILISKWSGHEVTVDGEVHVFVGQDEIVAVLEEEPVSEEE